FTWGHRYLDTGWGLINTIAMILSSFTMALAVYCAQRNHRETLMLFLSLTIVCGVCFLGVKAIEYRHKAEAGLLWGRRFQPVIHPVADAPKAPISPALPPAAPDGVVGAAGSGVAGGNVAAGRRFYMATCMGCHGADGEGMAG